MSKMEKLLRSAKIHNNYELLRRFGKGRAVAVTYRAPAPGRLGWSDTQATKVWATYKVDGLEPDSMSQTYSRRFLGKRERSWPEAIEWAGRYGFTFVPSPFGGRVPDFVVRSAAEYAAKQQEEKIT